MSLVSLHVILPAPSPQPGTETIAKQLVTESKAETERQELRQRHNITTAWGQKKKQSQRHNITAGDREKKSQRHNITAGNREKKEPETQHNI